MVIAPARKEVLVLDLGRRVDPVGAGNAGVDRSGKQGLGVKQRLRIKHRRRNFLAGRATRLRAVRIRYNRYSRRIALEWIADVTARVGGVRPRAEDVIDGVLTGKVASHHGRRGNAIKSRATNVLTKPLVTAEKEGFVTYKGPAEVGAELVLLQRVDRRFERISCVKLVISQEFPQGPVELVRPALGDDVNVTPKESPVLHRIRVAHHLKLLDIIDHGRRRNPAGKVGAIVRSV